MVLIHKNLDSLLINLGISSICKAQKFTWSEMSLQSVMQQILGTQCAQKAEAAHNLLSPVYIRLDITIHKTIPIGTHLSFHVT
jgi:hypothetical protein